MEIGNLVFLYDDESVINIPFPEFRCDDSEHQPLKPLQDGFGDEPRYRGAHRRTLNLLVVAVFQIGNSLTGNVLAFQWSP